jgi:hypothetical protein
MFGVPRSTVYGHLDKATIGTRPAAPGTGRAAHRTPLPVDTRPVPSVDKYDQLLTLRPSQRRPAKRPAMMPTMLTRHRRTPSRDPKPATSNARWNGS